MQWRMLQQDTPEDFVIATGWQESVRTFIELSAKASVGPALPEAQGQMKSAVAPTRKMWW